MPRHPFHSRRAALLTAALLVGTGLPAPTAPERPAAPRHLACSAGAGPSGSGFAGRALPPPLLAPGDFHYLGTYPANCRPGWTVDLQGVTHDSAAWYFTQKNRLWRFPVDHDLGEAGAERHERVRHTGIPDALSRAGYDHFGALAWHAGLLLIPVTGTGPAVVALFRSRDLAYLGHFPLPAQHGAGWLAVGPDDQLYSSDSELEGARGLVVYAVDWVALTSGRLPPAPLTPSRTVPLLDESGRPVRLRSMQGGVFAGRGVLYTVNGYCEGTTRETGLMAFVIRGDTGRRVTRSTEKRGPYQFEYHPGHRGLFWCREEPEGLTWWDLDDGRAPGIRGQLHVLMIDNAIWDYGGLYFRHYRIATGG